MFFNLRLQALFVLLDSSPGAQPFEESPECSHFRSSAFRTKNRPMMAAVCSQPRNSACNCLRPPRVDCTHATSRALGFFLAIVKSFSAACRGRRVPCSQLRTAFGLTFKYLAKSG